MKLLVVDDSAMIRRAVQEAYQNTVFSEIETAPDGVLAVSIFKSFTPDVVTLDITMPHMDGLAALSQMLKINPKVHVLVISALADHHTAIQALARGAEQFICKPFTPGDLKEALDELMDGGVREVVSKRSQEFDKQVDVTASSVTAPVPSPVPVSPPVEYPSSPASVPQPAQYPSGYVRPPSLPNPGSHATRSESPMEAQERPVFIQAMQHPLQRQAVSSGMSTHREGGLR